MCTPHWIGKYRFRAYMSRYLTERSSSSTTICSVFSLLLFPIDWINENLILRNGCFPPQQRSNQWVRRISHPLNTSQSDRQVSGAVHKKKKKRGWHCRDEQICRSAGPLAPQQNYWDMKQSIKQENKRLGQQCGLSKWTLSSRILHPQQAGSINGAERLHRNE